MPNQPPADIKFRAQNQLGELFAALDSGTGREVRRMLSTLTPQSVAQLLESSPPRIRQVLWKLIDHEVEGEVLQELSDDVRSQILATMDTEEMVAVMEGLDADDVADILQDLPERVMAEVLSAMSETDRARVEDVLAYDEETAGGLMDTDTISVRPNLSLDVVLRYLRRHEQLPESTDSLFVVNRKGQYIGLLPLSKLLTTDPSVTVREVVNTDVDPIPADMPDTEVARLFEKYDWITAPVVDEDNRLVGRITIDDVVDVIREDADHSLMSLAGLDEEEDTFAPVRRTARRRAVWLGINLLTALLASWVISLFQGTLDKVVALAVLMPIVASMGGVAGSQTLTVVIRGMALGQIGRSNLNWLLSRELGAAALNALLWSLVMGAITALWFNDSRIALVIVAAMVINLLTAALAGAILPVALRAMRIDPALAGGVALTTVTDVVGFLSFLGLATWYFA
ncbi:magnesium transporter [Microbulbifer thermotolerans]|uniref:Magnesium transporter MgtE n=1 Tax=Microbulbifer thermotolerans TaxID=252514 RepID=A0A143HK27_MICTH|nr:magnesium transporter [Microbulbifer thermotolerans]AMX02023.1 magnesium transporter [Microbulbifer thermotolerans]MCX2780794.1 magnesium transporter [Microbulbifer thermotolerans]MCX2783110.1 magnesium transporter [Microbulbifer thermotolerans]MCX2794288.1 magnesium transporter [Microbulbifer thermotolerans]MCX2806475.1 magnesium transporter [Microbulbifer thermotolerans]